MISYAVFCLKKNGDHRDLHLSIRRQRQMCIRDRYRPVYERGTAKPTKPLHPRLDTMVTPVSYTHLRAHETRHDLVCRLLLEKKRRPPRSTPLYSSAASDVYKRQVQAGVRAGYSETDKTPAPTPGYYGY